MRKLNVLKYILLLFVTLNLTNCSKNDEKLNEKEYSYFYETEKIIIHETVNVKINADGESRVISTKVSSTDPLDVSSDLDEMSNYLESIQPNIKIETLLDDSVIVAIDIEKGSLLRFNGPKYPNNGLCPECDHDSDGNISDSTECSQQGIKHCAFSTYQQWSTAHIIFGSIDGEVQAVLEIV